MSDMLARNSDFQPSRLAERAGRPVAEAQASNGAGTSPDRNARSANASPGKGPHKGDVERSLSSVAEVAEAQAKVARLLSDISAMKDGAGIDVDAVEAQVTALFPRPTVIVPMPPASRTMVEQAVRTAESMRASAALSQSAQANVDSTVAEAVIA